MRSFDYVCIATAAVFVIFSIAVLAFTLYLQITSPGIVIPSEPLVSKYRDEE